MTPTTPGRPAPAPEPICFDSRMSAPPLDSSPGHLAKTGVTHGRHVGMFATAIAITAALAGCASHHRPAATKSPSPQPARTTPAPFPAPTDTTMLNRVPSIVPYANDALRKLGVDIPLEHDESECHSDKATTRPGALEQTCRWHPTDVGPARYRLLAVTIVLENDPRSARDGANLSVAMFAHDAKPVALDCDAFAGSESVNRAVTINGEHGTLPLDGARLAARLHNVTVDIDWLGADYKLSSHGEPTDVTGIARDLAIRQATAIAREITSHI